MQVKHVLFLLALEALELHQRQHRGQALLQYLVLYPSGHRGQVVESVLDLLANQLGRGLLSVVASVFVVGAHGLSR